MDEDAKGKWCPHSLFKVSDYGNTYVVNRHFETDSTSSAFGYNSNASMIDSHFNEGSNLHASCLGNKCAMYEESIQDCGLKYTSFIKLQELINRNLLTEGDKS